MKLSLNWIKDYVKLPEDMDLKQLAYDLTMSTVEVEGAEDLSERFDKIVVGEIREVLPHPNADKLRVCKVDVGAEAADEFVEEVLEETVEGVEEAATETVKEEAEAAAEEVAEKADETTEDTEDESTEESEDEMSEDDADEASEKTKKGLFKKKKDKRDEQIEELTDQVKRQMAEFDNFRKRTEKEKSMMFDMGAKTIIEKILPVVDNFERGS